jgi:hypothetical protein
MKNYIESEEDFDVTDPDVDYICDPLARYVNV